jgi:hypothetical protein
MARKIDLSKLPKYNRLKILYDDYLRNEELREQKIYKRYVFCKCDCGNIKSIHLKLIRKGNTMSCGCLQNEFRSINIFPKKHGGSGDKIYVVWNSIIQRCYNVKNKSYNRYGARGITMCDEWRNDYLNFKGWVLSNGHQEGLQLDRIDNNGNYEPNNCRFVTCKINNRNRNNNIFIEYKGESKTLGEWAELLRIRNCVLNNRIKRLGWSIKKAFETPTRKNSKTFNKTT